MSSVVAPIAWDPEQYARFREERNQPFFDLVRSIGGNARSVVDLGCGDGRLTRELLTLWPQAQVLGIDSSPEMIARADKMEPDANLHFLRADIRDFEPEFPIDVIVSNAALQWVPDHFQTILRIANHLSKEGRFAFQLPGNYEAPSHTLLTTLTQSPNWKSHFTSERLRPSSAHSVDRYITPLLENGFQVRAWETTYVHILPSSMEIVEWMKGTSLRPVLEQLSVPEQTVFLAEYATLIADAYPAQSFGVLFRFRRLFCILYNRHVV